MIYFDSAATSFQKPAAVRRAVLSAMEGMSSPARGDYLPARRAAETLYRCREEAAALFGMENSENVVFTFNATHALNIAIRSLIKDGDRVVLSGYEHNAVTRCLAAFENLETAVAMAPRFYKNAMAEAFDCLITKDTAAVICTHVSNVFGFVLPVDEIAEMCKGRGVPLIVDAAQSAGAIAVDAKKWQAAFIAMPGHKGLLGPQGTGLLLCGEAAQPLLYGGTGSESLKQKMPHFLPDRLEAGTHNVPGIAGLLEGIRFVKETGFTAIENKKEKLVNAFAKTMEGAPRCHLFLPPVGQRRSGVVSAVFQGMECEEMASRLARRGICVRAGYHCAPLAHATAGTWESGTVRFSFSPFNTVAEAIGGAETVRDILLRSR